jgi:hypothetical protein
MTKQRLSQALEKFRLGAGELGSCINPGVQVRKCIEFKCIEVLKCIEHELQEIIFNKYFFAILQFGSGGKSSIFNSSSIKV